MSSIYRVFFIHGGYKFFIGTTKYDRDLTDYEKRKTRSHLTINTMITLVHTD